ncbi:hypothetical v-GCR [Porcine lymphotropic herpesvirus 2]|uniref:A5 homolog n=2 Tax=Suid gammaherpesvirus 4 TaxID=1960250 RepID=Q9Q6Z5_9GAMA|nr:hypothetical v-GCR [Porcine lymphotropic herpesvirus 2]AAF16523.1 A5 homolog [Porcine lymphotropic herpesvirus 2]AAO12355.1 hypothetical v-GCR [Porcine lymphotropic herpesvirus 2]
MTAMELPTSLDLKNMTGNQTCPDVYNAAVFWIGNVIQFLVVIAALFFLWLFVFKARLRPTSNIWLAFYVLAYLFAILSRILQDFAGWTWKCVLTECMLLFSMLLTSAVVVGMSIDRCLTLFRGSRGGMAPWQILVFVLACTILCMIFAVANFLSFGTDYAVLSFEGNEAFKCRQGISVESLKLKFILRGVYFIICLLIVLLVTIYTLWKILLSKLKQKKAVACNLILVNLLICGTWVVLIFSSLKQAANLQDTCPSSFATGIGAYLMQLTVLCILAVFVVASRHLKRVLLETVVIFWPGSTSSQ